MTLHKCPICGTGSEFTEYQDRIVCRKCGVMFKPSLDTFRRDELFGSVQDLLTNWLYYDRKEDVTLPVGAIEKAITDGVVTVEELTGEFKRHLQNAVDSKRNK